MSIIRWEENPVPLGKRMRTATQNAIRELNRRAGLLKDLHDTVEDKSDIVNAISGVSDRVGKLSDLKTTDKSTIVKAINIVWTYVKSTLEKWLGKSDEVDSSYKTAHGDTISKLVNYLLGRDLTNLQPSDIEGFDSRITTAQKTADKANTAAAGAQTTATDAKTAADSAAGTASAAQKTATAAKTTADTANTWLGDKSEVSSDTLTHGDTVSALIEYLANNSGGTSAATLYRVFVGNTINSGETITTAEVSTYMNTMTRDEVEIGQNESYGAPVCLTKGVQVTSNGKKFTITNHNTTAINSIELYGEIMPLRYPS